MFAVLNIFLMLCQVSLRGHGILLDVSCKGPPAVSCLPAVDRLPLTRVHPFPNVTNQAGKQLVLSVEHPVLSTLC